MIRFLRHRIAAAGRSDAALFFPLFGFPVRIRASYGLLILLWGLRRSHLGAFTVWVLVATLSILIHELGHAIAARRFGFTPTIELNGMGGLTRWSQWRLPKWTQAVLISLAGPAAGFAVGFLAHRLEPALLSSEGAWADHWLPHLALQDLLWVNVGWGVFNLLPIVPLDGGQAAAAVLRRVIPGRAERAIPIIGLLTAIGGGIAAIGMEQTWALVLLAFFGYQNVQKLQALRGLERRTEWQRPSSWMRS